MIQMVRRGLRTVDPAEHPGVHKTDCVVLDFGVEPAARLARAGCRSRRPKGRRQRRSKDCPDCGAAVPLATMECPLCGHLWLSEDEDGEGAGAAPLEGFVMTEIDLLKRSSFRWEDLSATTPR